jgi:hypothetical protein
VSEQKWKSQPARDLVSFYLQRKPGVLAGERSLDQLNTEPRFVAGMLLRVYGGGALEAYRTAKVALGASWPREVEQLLRATLDAELRAVHGEPACCFCHYKSTTEDDLNDWLVSGRGRWACPSCIRVQGLAEGQEVEPSS